MNFDELFKIDESFDENIKMTKDEFIAKAKEIFLKMDKEYSLCWMSRVVTDEEYQENDCENCEGQCTLKIDGKEVDCFSNEDGDCSFRYFDSELFSEEIENIMFHDTKSNFYDLLYCDIDNEKQSV